MPPCEEPARTRQLLDNATAFLLVRAIINDMAYCDLCEMDRDFCEHGSPYLAGVPLARFLVPDGLGGADRYGALATSRDRRRERR